MDEAVVKMNTSEYKIMHMQHNKLFRLIAGC